MKLCFVSTMAGYPWGGSEELWYRSALYALKDGHTVLVVVYHWDEEPRQISDLRDKGATIVKRSRNLTLQQRIKTRMLNAIGVKPINGYAKHIRSFSPDRIIVSQGMTFDVMYDDNLRELIKSLACNYYLISQFNTESGGIIPGEKRNNLKEFISNASIFFFVSERNKIIAERQLADDIKNFRLISNPVNILHHLKPFPEKQFPLKLACVARLECSVKGQDIMLQALSSPAWRDRDFQLSLYGKGPDELYLRELIDHYKLADKVKLHGQVSYIDQVWSDHHVCIQPSLAEGTPLSVVEAMLSGRAVISSDVGGVSKYVLHCKTGFLINAVSSATLSNVLEEVWKQKDYLKEMGYAAYEHALAITDLTPEKTLAELIRN